MLISNELLQKSFQERLQLVDEAHQTAFRILNGFYEGLPGINLDIYARTLVISDHAYPSQLSETDLSGLKDLILVSFPWVESILLKVRSADKSLERNGRLIHGIELPRTISEDTIQYAIDLTLNQDDSFYLDTRHLRSWLRQNMRGRTLLNTFAYTGTLGIAALAGGAIKIIQTDNTERFLKLAKESSRLNNISGAKSEYMVMDFFHMVDRFKTSGTLFDCVILDPPFYSQTRFGKVDAAQDFVRLINKVRPLIAHNGYLVAVNNALFLPGQSLLDDFEKLSQSGYIKMSEMIPIPEDVRGYPDTIQAPPPVDPAPFNHPTKISILKIIRKDQGKTNLKI